MDHYEHHHGLLCEFLRRDFAGNQQIGSGRLPSFHGTLYQQGYGGIGTLFSRLARMAMPVVRLLMPHVVSGIGELASSIATATGSNHRKRKVKRVLRKHGLRVADDVIKKLQSKYENDDDDSGEDEEPQTGGGGRRRKRNKKLATGASVYKRRKLSKSTHSAAAKPRRPVVNIEERDIFG